MSNLLSSAPIRQRLDVEEGLDRLMGERALYLQILRRFLHRLLEPAEEAMVVVIRPMPAVARRLRGEGDQPLGLGDRRLRLVAELAQRFALATEQAGRGRCGGRRRRAAGLRGPARG